VAEILGGAAGRTGGASQGPEKGEAIMTESKDYLGETLRLVERAREDVYFRKLDQELIARMRQQNVEPAEEATQHGTVFTPILVPVDFSPSSTKALLCAADIAERFAASLIVLHVIAREVGVGAMQQRLRQDSGSPLSPPVPPDTPEMPREVMETVMADCREQAYTELQAFVPSRLAQYPVELRVVIGHPFERIIETAVREQAGLIIMGTHGRTGLSRVAMGSVAERVVRLASCPVLTVKAPTSEEASWLQGLYETFLRPTSV
jgi:nucleotide-binding universal stress UspA family protein